MATILIIGCVFLTGSVIIKDIKPSVSHVILYASNVLNSLGMAAIYANLLPFITDQMIGASADELGTAVHWWIWSQTFPTMIAYNVPCVLQDTPQILTSIFLIFLWSNYCSL